MRVDDEKPERSGDALDAEKEKPESAFDEDEPEIPQPIMKRIGRTLSISALIVVAVAVIGVLYGLVAHGRFTLEYAFLANFAVAAVLIAGGFLFPVAPNRLVDRFRSSQLADYKMYGDYMEARKRKQKEGYGIMWIGITVGCIAGILETVIWYLVR